MTVSRSFNDARTMAHKHFDWVTARQACSLAKCFASLKAQIDGDIKTRNSLLPEGSAISFGLGDNGNSFIVLTEPHGHLGRSATFTLRADHIEVMDEKGGIRFKITLTLDVDGDCMFRIDGDDEEYEPWYVRKKALEDVFFPSIREKTGELR